MTTEVSNKKYRLRKMGGATDVMLFAHGAWSTGDGKLFVPDKMVIYFYCAHGVFGTKGVPIAERMMGADSPLSQAVLAALFQRKSAEQWSDARLDQEILEAKGAANSQGTPNEMQVVDQVQGKGFGRRQKVYNYLLAHNGPSPNDRRAENLWETHSNANAAIDLLIMQQDAEGHLASAIDFALDKGEKYQGLHFLPCRYIAADDTKSMRTVVANVGSDNFGGGDFKRTTVVTNL